MKKIGITGYGGRLGRYLLKTYPNYVGLDCDVTCPVDVDNCILKARVDSVLHLAAKSDVDWCEKPENFKKASDVNLRGSFNVCHAAEKAGVSQVILLSSDHVFSGRWGRYREKDKPNPVNYYGMSKFSAESLYKVFDNLKIVRTSYLFDRERLNKQLSDIWNGVPSLYPTFIFRSFMYIPHFARSLNQYLSNYDKMPRILHISGSKTASWFDLMNDISKKAGIQNYKKLIVPKVQASASMAPRPYWGGLNTNLSRKLGFPQYSYHDGINQMLEDWKL